MTTSDGESNDQQYATGSFQTLQPRSAGCAPIRQSCRSAALADHLCRCGNSPVAAPVAAQAGPRSVYPVGPARSSQALLSGGMKRTRKTTYAATSKSRRREARILSDVREFGEFETRHAGDKRILRRMAKRGAVIVVLSKSGWFRPPALKAFLTRADALIQYDKSLILRP